MKRLMLEIGGRRHEVWAERIRGTLWIHFKGRTFSISGEEHKGRRGRGTSGSTHPGQLLAPMPGKVIKVMAAVGELVTAGKALVIMEAMKMEYTLAADVPGTVQEIACKVGEQVKLGQVLARINPAGDSP